MLRIELTLLLASLLFAWLHPTAGTSLFERLERRFAQISNHQNISLMLVAICGLILRAGMLPVIPVPEPIVHDEFVHLLAADTFAHGRLTNPTPPLWEHFETFHVMFHPTYASIYPPAQGLVLALGRAVFGHPFWGVWLSAGLMCAAITWMLQGWMSPPWALLGGVLAVLRYGVFSYWADSYWGGAMGAIGGAVVLGALPRIKQSLRVPDSLLMGIGLAILANSRPYEGFVFALPIAFLLIAWMLGENRPPFRLSLRRIILPMAIILAITAAGMGYYQWRVTGSPFRMPYQIERQTYAIAPYMIWQKVRPEPEYHHPVMRKMFVEEEMFGRSVFSSFAGLLLRLYLAWSFFLGPALTLPLLTLAISLPRGFSLREIDRSTVSLLIVFGTSVLGSVLVNFYSPHYSAPTTGLFLALPLLSMRVLRRWGSAGLFLSRAVLVICLISFAARAASDFLRIPRQQSYQFSWYQRGRSSFGRAAVEKELQQEPGNHLVIVNYKPDHKPFEEWVYNDADIDRAKIVWAREMSQDEDQKIIQYFADRETWVLDADATPPQLQRLR